MQYILFIYLTLILDPSVIYERYYARYTTLELCQKKGQQLIDKGNQSSFKQYVYTYDCIPYDPNSDEN